MNQTSYKVVQQFFLVMSLCLTALGCSPRGCGGRSTPMRTMTEIHESASEKLPNGGDEASWPIPIVETGTLRAAVFWYHCSGIYDDPWVAPPYRLMVLNVETASVIRSAPVVPRDIGPDVAPGTALPGKTKIDVASVDELEKLRARMSALAPGIWAAFGEGRTLLTAQERHDVAEYVTLLDKTEPAQLHPYYRGVGKGFYEWAARVQGAAPR